MGKIFYLTKNLIFWSNLSSFRAENKRKTTRFKFQINTQTLPKQLVNKFEKVQKTTFLTPKIVRNDPSKPL